MVGRIGVDSQAAGAAMVGRIGVDLRAAGCRYGWKNRRRLAGGRCRYGGENRRGLAGGRCRPYIQLLPLTSICRPYIQLLPVTSICRPCINYLLPRLVGIKQKLPEEEKVTLLRVAFYIVILSYFRLHPVHQRMIEVPVISSGWGSPRIRSIVGAISARTPPSRSSQG